MALLKLHNMELLHQNLFSLLRKHWISLKTRMSISPSLFLCLSISLFCLPSAAPHLQLLQDCPSLSQMVLNSSLTKQILMYTTDLLHFQQVSPCRDNQAPSQVSQNFNNNADQIVMGSNIPKNMSNTVQKTAFR